MGLFGSSKNEVNYTYGYCLYCNKAMIGKINTKTRTCVKKPDATTADGKGFMCEDCYKSRNLLDYDIKDVTLPELLLTLKKKGFADPKNFTVSKRVYRLGKSIGVCKDHAYLEIDEERELINIPFYDKGIFSPDIIDCLYTFDEILDFKIIENGVSVTEGANLLGAAVGGLVFGGAGAIVGAMAGSRKTQGKCNEMVLKITVNRVKNSTRYLHIIGQNTEFKESYLRSSQVYEYARDKAEYCASLLTIILKRNKEKSEEKSIENVTNAINNKNSNKSEINTWKCSCGEVNTGKFCSGCGLKKPDTWTCVCGNVNIGQFCSECGLKKPDNSGVWKCSCGEVNTGNFCTVCGLQKKEDVESNSINVKSAIVNNEKKSYGICIMDCEEYPKNTKEFILALMKSSNEDEIEKRLNHVPLLITAKMSQMTLENLLDTIKKENLKVAIIPNSDTLKDDFNKIVEEYRTEKIDNSIIRLDVSHRLYNMVIYEKFTNSEKSAIEKIFELIVLENHDLTKKVVWLGNENFEKISEKARREIKEHTEVYEENMMFVYYDGGIINTNLFIFSDKAIYNLDKRILLENIQPIEVNKKKIIINGEEFVTVVDEYTAWAVSSAIEAAVMIYHPESPISRRYASYSPLKDKKEVNSYLYTEVYNRAVTLPKMAVSNLMVKIICNHCPDITQYFANSEFNFDVFKLIYAKVYKKVKKNLISNNENIACVYFSSHMISDDILVFTDEAVYTTKKKYPWDEISSLKIDKSTKAKLILNGDSLISADISVVNELYHYIKTYIALYCKSIV